MKNKLHLCLISIAAVTCMYFASCAPDVKAESSSRYRAVAFNNAYAGSGGDGEVDTTRVVIDEINYMVFSQYRGGIQVIKLESEPQRLRPPLRAINASYIIQDSGDLPLIPKLRDPYSFYGILDQLDSNIMNLQSTGDVIELTGEQALELVGLQNRLKQVQLRISDVLLNRKITRIYNQ